MQILLGTNEVLQTCKANMCFLHGLPYCSTLEWEFLLSGRTGNINSLNMGARKKGRKRKHLHTQCVPFSTECACCLCLTSKFIQTNSWHLQGNSSPPAGNQRQGYGNDKIGRHIKVKQNVMVDPSLRREMLFPAFPTNHKYHCVRYSWRLYLS